MVHLSILHGKRDGKLLFAAWQTSCCHQQTGRVRSDQSLPLTWGAPAAGGQRAWQNSHVRAKRRSSFGWVEQTGRKKVPNRDSSDYRIDEANLFLLHRYQGKDYVLPGTRADLGVSGVANDRTFGKLAGFIGLSRRISGKPSAGLAPDQGNIYSDYVASLSINPPQNISLGWSGRMSSRMILP